MDTKVSRAFRDEELYADTPELDKNLNLVIHEEEESISNIRLKLGELENEITGKVVNVDESQLDLDYSYGEEVELKVSQPPKPDYDPLDKNLKIDYRKETLKRIRKNRKLTNLFGKRPRTDIKTLKNYEYSNGAYHNHHEPLDDDPLDEKIIEDFVNFETFEKEEFFEVIRNEYSKFEIAETFNQNIKPSIFDYLVKTPEIEKVNSSQLDETSQRAIDVYREINGSLFHKHYLSKLFKMQQMDNPAQINEMLDPLDDPNFGIMRTNTVDNFVKFGTKEREDFVPDIVKYQEPNKMYYEGVMPTYFGSGSRKRSKAFAIVELNGTGNVTINDRHFIEYFNDAKYRSHILKSVVAIGKTCEVNLKVYVHGSGHSSQADAVLVAISNALIKAFPEYEKFLVDRYFTFIDTRRVERKKTSKYKARKSYTYVRR